MKINTCVSLALKLIRRAENDFVSVTFSITNRLPEDNLIGKDESLII